MQRAVKDIYVDPLIKQYIVALVDATRKHESVYLGASPRGSLALYRTCQARALLDGRDFVMPDDVKELAYATLGHRIIVSPSARVKNVTAQDIVEQRLERIPVPGARARGGAAVPIDRRSRRRDRQGTCDGSRGSTAGSSSRTASLTAVVILWLSCVVDRAVDRLLADVAAGLRRR